MYEVQGKGIGGITECSSGEHCLRSAATEAETPLETSRLISIKINNASVYEAQISPRSPKAPPVQNRWPKTAEVVTEMRERPV